VLPHQEQRPGPETMKAPRATLTALALAAVADSACLDLQAVFEVRFG
jgi:hypothetical protein